MPPTHEGWLYKQKPNAITTSWDRRFFRIDGMKLFWYETQDASEAKNFLPLKLITEVQKANFTKTPKPHHARCGFQITAQEKKVRHYCLVAETTEEAQEWVTMLNATITFYRNRGWSLPDGSLSSTVSKSIRDSDVSVHVYELIFFSRVTTATCHMVD
jgi:hypothetical protein